MQHTPGPWQVNAGARGTFFITAENNVAVVQTYEPNQSMRVLVGAAAPEANARLIAAAPDMLSALQKADELLGGERPGSKTVISIRAAIAKAIAAA